MSFTADSRMRWAKRTLLTLMVGILGAALGAKWFTKPLPKPTIFHDEITVDEVRRTFRLAVPTPRLNRESIPVVFAFHGQGDNGESFATASQLDELTGTGFAVVYPEAIRGHWPLEVSQAERDLRFFDAICERLSERFHMDCRRLYLTGFSNGAHFVHLVASQRPEIITAIAPNAGWLGNVQPANPTGRVMPVLIIFGKNDTQVPVAEARKAEAAYAVFSVTLEETPAKHTWDKRINSTIASFFHSHQQHIFRVE